MIKFSKKIFIFLFPIILIFIGFELFYRLVPNDYSYKFDTIQTKFENTKVLVFGNSHTFYGLNPQYFDKPTYNISHVSQTLYFDKILFDNYIDKFKKIEWVILHIEYTSLSEIVNTDENNWRKYYYQYYMNLNVPSIKPYNLQQYFLSATRTFNGNINLIKRYYNDGTIVDCDQNGFGINYTKKTKQIINLNDALNRVKSIEDNLMDFSENISRIEAIIKKCKSKNIKILLLRMPVTNYFSKNVNLSKLQKINETCIKITNQNPNVIYLNLFKDTRFTNDDFYDSDHLHSDGAIKSSKIVNAFLKSK